MLKAKCRTSQIKCRILHLQILKKCVHVCIYICISIYRKMCFYSTSFTSNRQIIAFSDGLFLSSSYPFVPRLETRMALTTLWFQNIPKVLQKEYRLCSRVDLHSHSSSAISWMYDPRQVNQYLTTSGFQL